MKRCLIRITRADGQSFSYSGLYPSTFDAVIDGLYPSTFDAVIDGLLMTVGEQVRISARVLP